MDSKIVEAFARNGFKKVTITTPTTSKKNQHGPCCSFWYKPPQPGVAIEIHRMKVKAKRKGKKNIMEECRVNKNKWRLHHTRVNPSEWTVMKLMDFT